MSVKMQRTDPQDPILSIRVLSLNCWGLKFISKYRSERLSEIGNRLATYNPPLDIVGLQECWCYSDFKTIREKVRSVLPYGKFYYSGVFGAGLAIFSRWSIEESSMHRYVLNGRPTAFFRGDWFVGKGVASALIRLPGGPSVEVFCTHLHAPYEKEPNDSYICHRTAQAWEIAKLMRAAQQRGSLTIGMGDFNMIPLSFAHVLVESRGDVKDVWRIVKPNSSVGASIDEPEILRRREAGEKRCPSVYESIHEHGHTSDSVTNTWRWSKSLQKDLRSGKQLQIKADGPDKLAKRLDYIFLGDPSREWSVGSAAVVMMERHPTLLCSLSDHFGIQTTLIRPDVSTRTPQSGTKKADGAVSVNHSLASSFYQNILGMIESYKLRERKQRRWRITHWVAWLIVAIACWIAIWWCPHNYLSFILSFVSSLGLMYGTVDGLIGALFVGSELRALAEFEWEVCNASRNNENPADVDVELKDCYKHKISHFQPAPEMALTRGATGNSRPRVFASVSTEPGRKRTTAGATTKKRRPTTTKKSTTGAGVTKKRAPATHHKRKTTIKDKVSGAATKVAGKIENKPGKKAAGTKRMRGTDGKGGRTAAAKKK